MPPLRRQISLELDLETLQDMQAALNRDLAIAERAMPKWVAERHMSAERATEHLRGLRLLHNHLQCLRSSFPTMAEIMTQNQQQEDATHAASAPPSQVSPVRPAP